MRHKILITMIAIFCFLAVPLWAQPNNYRKADHALRQVYKQVTGISLKDAIDSLLAEQPDSLYDSTSRADETPPIRRSCPPPKSSNPNLIYIPDGALKESDIPIDINQFVLRGKNGTYVLPVRIKFTGDRSEIQHLNIRTRWLSETLISANVPLEMLPMLCQTKGIQYIHPAPRATLE